jgi:predicted O-methyltransferase YrrM
MKLQFILDYLKYYFTSGNRHHVHSPFLYAFVDDVMKDRPEPEFQKFEAIRNKLQRDHTYIEMQDFGAGGQGKRKRKISAVACNSAKPAKYCRLLYRIVRHFQPKTMLELGTSLGISALYQAAGNKNGILITIEGDPASAAIAEQNFQKTGSNIRLVTGNFHDLLPALLPGIEKPDYVFIDGDHRLKATLSLFNLCLQHAHNGTVFIFDDINWSDEMKAAWTDIKNHPQVTATIDVFMFGIVFINKDLSKEHFRIRY